MQSNVKELVLRTRAFFEKTGKKKVVLGLSGGVDSSLVCAILVRALGAQNVTGLLMPFMGISDKKNLKDAKDFAKSLNVKTIAIEINPFLHGFEALPWKQNNQAKTNLMPRVRAVLLYNYANSNGCLVAGTGNRTELALGYFTKHGDGAADFFPIGGLWKTQVFQLAGVIGVPEEIISKKPTAELWRGQTDEEEMGLTYKEIDKILSKLFDEKTPSLKLTKLGVLNKNVKLIVERVKANKHKTKLPPIIKIKYT